MKFEEIERLFQQDIREKRRTGSGAFHKTGKGVKHHIGGVRTPYDNMTTKERKLLNGKVVVTNMYETILTRAEFELKDEETQKLLLTRWREIYSNKQILKSMGISSNTLMMFLNKLNIEQKKKGGKRRMKDVNVKVEEQQQVNVPLITESFGLSLKYNGVYKSEQITKILTKLQLLMDEEQGEFSINISIKEK